MNFFKISLFVCFIFVGNLLYAQDRADFEICNKDGTICSGIICISPTDTLYEVKIKIKLPTTCTVKTFEIDWGDTQKENVTLPASLERSHKYFIKDYINNCNKYTLPFRIFVTPDCVNSDKGLTLTFNKKPQASITSNDACEGKATQFKNNSCPVDSKVNYLWDLGNGTTSTAFQPSVNYANSATPYAVKLTVTTPECGTSVSTLNVPIKKFPTAIFKPTSGFTVVNTDTVVCLSNGGLLTMDGTASIDASRYQWEISGGSFSYVDNTTSSSSIIKIKFNESKTYTITLKAINDCGESKPLICKHKVISEPTLTITPQPDDCNPIKYQLKSPNALASYTFNGSPLGLTEIKDAGYATTPYIIEATLKYECGTKTAKPDTFFVLPKQPVKITSFRDTTICVGTGAVLLQADVAGGTWSGSSLIENQGTSKVFNPKTIGTYDISYDLGTGTCATNDKIKINVQGISITANDESICQGQPTLLLKATPTGGSWTTSGCTGCIKGDTLLVSGLTSLQIKLNYTVTAPVTGGKSCNASKEITVKIGSPKADFDISGGCSGTNAVVTNKSSGASSFQWFLNGSSTAISTASNPSFPLPSGVVDVKLTAISGTCDNSISKQITVSTPPDAIGFTTNSASGCSPFPVTFTLSGTPRSDVTYTWEFGDGSSSVGFQPTTYTYKNQTPKAQDFQIKVTAKNACGEKNDTKQITVRPLAKAEIGVDSTTFRCSPASVKFSNRSTGYSGGVSWVFGDGQVSNSLIDTLSHKFSAKDSIKTFNVKLIVSNDCGTDTSKVDIKVYPENIKPFFTMEKIEACAGEPVKFTDATVPKPNRWLWKFGNEDKAVSANPTYAFKNANQTYQITMIAFTVCGYDSLQRNIKIVAPPTVKFELPSPNTCEGQSVQIKNTSDALYSFKWDFGDGSGIDSVSFSPTHIFTGSSGTKTITLTGFGASPTCKNEFKKDIFIRTKPKADFDIGTVNDTLCSAEPVKFENKSTNATQYTWYFGNGTISKAQNPELSFSAGLHDVALVATYEGTCKDSVFRSGYFAIDTCQVEIPEAFSPNGDGIGDFFTLFGTKGIRNINYLRIRNRWGLIIFEKKDFAPNIPSEGWDGRLKDGTEAPVGEYVYEAEVAYVGNRVRKFTKNILLAR